MEQTIEGLQVVTSDDHKIGRVVGTRDDCVLVETGHLFKSRHAIPSSFVHRQDDELRATVSKEIVESSPKIEDESWSCEEILVHYGLAGPFEVDPDPDGVDNAETEGQRAGIEPAPQERMGTLTGTEPPSQAVPTVRERQGNAYDPTGSTANLE
ncbi:MAG TPA: hypothetical protein VFA19_12470 [Gaiellaceae bacterium]|nr:hypothetical protein [Gaiellaceae bacterium]